MSSLLREKLGIDVQLKALQTLTSIVQNYASSIEDESQGKLLEVCTTLQQVKTPAVRNSASATLQQIITNLFEKVDVESSGLTCTERDSLE